MLILLTSVGYFVIRRRVQRRGNRYPELLEDLFLPVSLSPFFRVLILHPWVDMGGGIAWGKRPPQDKQPRQRAS